MWRNSLSYIRLQNIFIEKNIRLKTFIPTDNEEVNFLYENNLPEDLKSKRSVATWQPSHDSPLSDF